MRKENYIGTQDLDEKSQKLIINNDKVFIEFKYYTVLEKMINVLEQLDYSTHLFKAEWNKWNYSDPNNLLLIKNELIRYPNDTYYLEIDTKTKFFDVCNYYHKNQILKNLNMKIADVTTTLY